MGGGWHAGLGIPSQSDHQALTAPWCFRANLPQLGSLLLQKTTLFSTFCNQLLSILLLYKMTALLDGFHVSLLTSHHPTAFFSERSAMESTLLHSPPTTSVASPAPPFFFLPSFEAGGNLISGRNLKILGPPPPPQSSAGQNRPTEVARCNDFPRRSAEEGADSGDAGAIPLLRLVEKGGRGLRVEASVKGVIPLHGRGTPLTSRGTARGRDLVWEPACPQPAFPAASDCCSRGISGSQEGPQFNVYFHVLLDVTWVKKSTSESDRFLAGTMRGPRHCLWVSSRFPLRPAS